MWPVFYIKDFIQILIYTVETKIVNILVVSEYTFIMQTTFWKSYQWCNLYFIKIHPIYIDDY